MDDDVAPKKPQPEVFDGPLLSSRDKAKIERRKRKEERQRETQVFVPDYALLFIYGLSCLLVQVQYQMHVTEMEALRAGMPPVYVNHSNDGGPAVRDIHMENISVTVGGRDLIQEATITLAFGRHYGEYFVVVKIADFGVSRNPSQEGDMTAESGTYRWMAPEVINHKPYDHRADIFSFGVILWELVTSKIRHGILNWGCIH
ncbi:unnamed protein product [Miscanthus lutarioriparius]|uniref:Protein kinase domain-containing protein n=1 Tax=Miscanthus lutarioriparius TaxID=422564 RepID=A0A811MSS0_9POAL|nr:unnamed protein product [Miscanthus lutarioriparius]